MKYSCPSCNFKHENVAIINKHISICKYYEEWYKTYTPPKYTKCNKCNKLFIDISEHLCNI